MGDWAAVRTGDRAAVPAVSCSSEVLLQSCIPAEWCAASLPQATADACPTARVRCERSREGVGVTDVSDPAAESGVDAALATPPQLASRDADEQPACRTRRPCVALARDLTRASVLPMTLTAAAIAGLLAAFHDENVRWGLFALAAVGLVLAHVANNLMNDLFDLEVGADSDSYPRALYAPHPVLSGTISRRGLLDGRDRRQRSRPRDPRRAGRVPRLADDRVRARRVPARRSRTPRRRSG